MTESTNLTCSEPLSAWARSRYGAEFEKECLEYQAKVGGVFDMELINTVLNAWTSNIRIKSAMAAMMPFNSD